MSESETIERPQGSLLSHDENRVQSTSQMANQLAGVLGEQDVPHKKAVSVASWQVAQAIKHGYVVPGWNLIDYVRSTWMGMENDKPSPVCICGKYLGNSEAVWKEHIKQIGEHRRKPRKRFQLINVWGEQGATKSSFVAQLLGLAHGGYDLSLADEEWKKVWDWCQTVTITNREDLERVGDMADKPGMRFDVLYFDDLNSIIPRQLAWEDRDLYRHTFELLGMIRRQTGTIFTTEPNIEMVIEAFNRVMTFEVIVYPNSMFKVERMCHDIHPYLWAKDKVTKIVIEEADFNPYDTPLYYWKPYEERTNIVGHGAFRKVIDRMRELEEDPKGEKEEAELGRKAIYRGATKEVSERYRAQGGKLDQHQIEKIVQLTKEVQLERLKKKTEDS